MNVEYINPFIEATKMVFKSMVGFDLQIGAIYLKESPYKAEAVAVIIGITGETKGQVTFCMNLKAALNIASKMMDDPNLAELDEISKSAISELANMILGNTSTLFFKRGISIDISPPTFLIGQNMTISHSKAVTICVPLRLPSGDSFEIDIAIADKK